MTTDDPITNSSTPEERRFWRRAVPVRFLILLLGAAVLFLIYFVIR